MQFNKWLDTFVEEKGIDINTERVFCVTASNGVEHHIPLGVVIEHMKIATTEEQAQIKNIIIKIDFHNGDVYDFLNHLAKGIAQNYNGVLA